MRRFSGMLWPVLLLALLAVLAWLQFRWTGQISASERERMQSSLQSSVRQFAGDVDGELVRLFQFFRADRPEELGARLEQYREETRYPELVSAIYSSDANGELSKLDGSDLVSVEWPTALTPVREQMSGRGRRSERGRRFGPPFPMPILSGDAPVVAIPIAARGGRRPGFSIVGYTLIALDAETLRQTMLPELVGRHFGEEYDVAIVDHNSEVVFATDDEHVAVDRPDANGELFSPSRFLGRPPRGGDDRRRAPPELVEARERLAADAWDVFVRHRAGSLEAFVSTARTRNLAVSFGILGLLAASIGLVAVSTRRATELNDRKMEFVAGVSHELRTPVAVLRSAGQNLADGSVKDPKQVKRYGSLIESEGRRLNDLVEQVLELAGIQSQKRRYRREPVLARTLVADALKDCESLRMERDVEVSTTFPVEGATVLGDPDAMRRAVGNIIINAIKHGGDDNTIDIVAEERGGKIAFEVADRGPGIPEREQAHLFEAFYRGSRAHDRQVQGSGLGLSLVDHVAREHGGSIEVESTTGKGSRFTLYLPAAAQTSQE